MVPGVIARLPERCGRRRTRQPVVDRLAEPGEGDRLDGDAGDAFSVERLEMGEQVARRLPDVARGGKIKHGGGILGARRPNLSQSASRFCMKMST